MNAAYPPAQRSAAWLTLRKTRRPYKSSMLPLPIGVPVTHHLHAVETNRSAKSNRANTGTERTQARAKPRDPKSRGIKIAPPRKRSHPRVPQAQAQRGKLDGHKQYRVVPCHGQAEGCARCLQNKIFLGLRPALPTVM